MAGRVPNPTAPLTTFNRTLLSHTVTHAPHTVLSGDTGRPRLQRHNEVTETARTGTRNSKAAPVRSETRRAAIASYSYEEDPPSCHDRNYPDVSEFQIDPRSGRNFIRLIECRYHHIHGVMMNVHPKTIQIGNRWSSCRHLLYSGFHTVRLVDPLCISSCPVGWTDVNAFLLLGTVMRKT